MSNKKLSSKVLTNKVLCSLLAAGVMSMCLPVGQAFAADKWELDGVTIEDKEQGGGWGDLHQTDILINSSTFKNNTNTGNDGPVGGAFSTYNKFKQLSVIINDSIFDSNKAITESENKNINAGALGGALMIKGSKIELNDVLFTNNVAKTTTGKAFAGGGAIYLDATHNVTDGVTNFFPTEAIIKVTKDMAFVGNNVEGTDDTWYANTYGAVAQSGGGFMYLDRSASAEFNIAEGATLTIGNVDSTGDMDSIASSIPIKVDENKKYAEITKSGSGTLTINSDLNKYYGLLTVNEGTMNVNKAWNIKNTVTINGGTLNLQDVILEQVDGKISAVDSNGNLKDYIITDPSTGELVLNGGTINVKSIDATNGSIILNGGILNVEETFTGDILAENGSSHFSAKTIKGDIIAKNNGTIDLDLGDDGTVYGDLTVDDSTVNLAGNITFDADADSGIAGAVNFGDKSLLMVDGSKITETAAISGADSFNVDESSKLYIDGAKKGETYKIFKSAEDITRDATDGSGWQDENISSDNKLLTFTGDNDGNNFNVTASLQKVNEVFDNQVVIGSVIDNTLANGDENSAAAKFFNKAVNYKVNRSDADSVNALNSLVNMGELAGVSHGTYSMSNIVASAAQDHLSLARGEHEDTDIWAYYVHNKEDVRDMDMGGMSGSYDLKYNGIVVGGDFYNKGKATAGVALSYAKGDINSVGNTVSTTNDAEYYGLSLYGRINNGDSAILGDISYLHGKNDITQNNSDTKITASPKSDAFSIGVKAEKAYSFGASKVVPYAGVRYLHLGVGDYNNSLGMNYSADDQNMWLLPVGVTYSYEAKNGAWTIRPILEAGYVWTAGDRSTDQTVSINGASDGFGFNVADSSSFIGRLAVEAEKDNVTFGLGYEYQKGDSVKASRITANMQFSF